MEQKEIAEARRVQIPEYIIGKMSMGYELSEKEKGVVKSKNKVYVLAHTSYRGMIKIRPQLRNLPGFALMHKLDKYSFNEFLNVSKPLIWEELGDMSYEELEEEHEYYNGVYWHVESVVDIKKIPKEQREKHEKRLKQLEKNIEIIEDEIEKRD